MKYPRRKDQYNCDLMCENFHEIDHRLHALEEGGGGSGSFEELSKADYEKLSEEEKNDENMVYFLPDGEGGGDGGSDIDINSLIDIIYPVGSIYFSANNVSPSLLFGGTWEQIKDRFLLSAGDTYGVGTTGGSASSTSGESSAENTGSTALTVAQIPSHNHTYSDYAVSTGTYQSTTSSGWKAMYTVTAYSYNTQNTGGGQGHTHSMAHTHSVPTMPPYIAVYVWKRTA